MAIPLTIWLGAGMKWTDRIGRRLKLRDLHIALAVAEAGSMTRAAEELAVSYPVVSKTISELEHTLGVKLFDRSISGVEPTHYGRALAQIRRRGVRRNAQGPAANRIHQRAGHRRPADRLVHRDGCRFASGGHRTVFARFSARGALRAARKHRDLAIRQSARSEREAGVRAASRDDERTRFGRGASVRRADCGRRWRRESLGEAAKPDARDLLGDPWVLAQPGSLARSLHDEVFPKGPRVPSAKVLTVSLHLHMRLIETGNWLGLIPPLPRALVASEQGSRRCRSNVVASRAGRLYHRRKSHAFTAGGTLYRVHPQSRWFGCRPPLRDKALMNVCVWPKTGSRCRALQQGPADRQALGRCRIRSAAQADPGERSFDADHGEADGAGLRQRHSVRSRGPCDGCGSPISNLRRLAANHSS